VKPPFDTVDGNSGESQPRKAAEAMTIATNFMAGTIVSHGPPAERMSSATWREGALVRSMIGVVDRGPLESMLWRWWPRFVPDGTH
jgi:hypothetical protein